MTDTDRILLDELVQESKREIAPLMKNDEFFEMFCAQHILAEQQLEQEELNLGLVGGDAQQQTGSDGGIDGIYVLVNRAFVRDAADAERLRSTFRQNVVIEVVLIQASQETGFKLTRLIRLKDTMEDIFSLDRAQGDFSENYNQALRAAIDTFRAVHRAFATRHPEVHVSCFYVTRGDSPTIVPDVRNHQKEIEQGTGEILATVKKCSVTFIGARELFDLANKRPVDTYPMKCEALMPEKKGACIALVKLVDYLKLITDDNKELRTILFESNVRDYEGEVAVNKAIQKTLDNPSKEDFWWLNNGITMVVQKLGGYPKELMLTNPQIVNGLQTSQRIFDHFAARPHLKDSETRELLVRVIEVNDPNSYDEIIEATNSQTRIKPASLWATKVIHRQIEAIFRSDGFYYDRRKNSYRRKGIPLGRVVGISELAQAVAAAFLQEADHARARPARYFQEESQHNRVFSEKYDIGLYGACARIRKRVDSFISSSESDRGHRHNLLFYVMLVATGLALRTPKARHSRIASLDIENKLTDALLQDALDIVRPIYVRHGSDDKAAKGTEVVREAKEELRRRFRRPKISAKNT